MHQTCGKQYAPQGWVYLPKQDAQKKHTAIRQIHELLFQSTAPLGNQYMPEDGQKKVKAGQRSGGIFPLTLPGFYTVKRLIPEGSAPLS